MTSRPFLPLSSLRRAGLAPWLRRLGALAAVGALVALSSGCDVKPTSLSDTIGDSDATTEAVDMTTGTTGDDSDATDSTSTGISTTGTTTTGTSGDDSDGSTTATPLLPCEERVSEEECLGSEPDSFCLWVTIEPWMEGDLCPAFAGAPSCIPAFYAGEGCMIPSCEDGRHYYREVAPGEFELFDHSGKCGVEPEGWMQCSEFEPAPPCGCQCA